ncbi:MAG: exodeoxyribonuclease VII large subunit [Phototrophicales bacterium]|nr:exodeoxyribonuclease VII large subunit [Phototrophicales bacterium]
MSELAKPKSVSELTRYINYLLTQDPALQDVWVLGEASNVRQVSSGHWYFTIKDKDSQLRCVMWRTTAQRQSSTPKDGVALELFGKIAVYAPQGDYQLIVDYIRPVGVGDLYQQFEKLKAKLAADGLFDADRKRQYPQYPQTIGVVTSATGAAFQDVLNVLSKRFPLAHVILSNTLVQGTDAPPQIVRAIERLNEHANCDVILLCRGGGSIEDLWAFNDERVARAVADSKTPIVTGVGHETDFTIVDFVSDERAPTPSAGAERITPDIAVMHEIMDDYDALLYSAMDDLLADKRKSLESVQRQLTMASPSIGIRNQQQRLDNLLLRAEKATNNRLTILKERLIAKNAALVSANPDAILARGYAIVIKSNDNSRVTSQLDATAGDGITIRLKDGELVARVEDKDTHGRYKRTLF